MGQCAIRLTSVLLLTLVLISLASSTPAIRGPAPEGNASTRQSAAPTLQSTNASMTGAYFDHVVLIMMENRALTDLCGSKLPPPCNGNLTSSKPATPFMAALANNYTLGTQYVSVINTSLPNYVAMIGGSTFNCNSGGCGPGGAGVLSASNLVDTLETKNVPWKGYFESYPASSGCAGTSSGAYNNLHNPFIWFHDIDSNSTRCAKLVNANPTSCVKTDCTLVNDLNGASPPGFAWLTPNECDNMHGNSVCTNNNCLGVSSTYRTPCITAGESYLKTLVPNILNSTAFKTQRSALFITFDEGTGNCPSPNPTTEDCVYTIWAGPVTKTNKFTSNNLHNHYSFLKTVEVNWNLSSLNRNDTSATDMNEFFSPTFSISPNPTNLTVSAGSNVTSTLTLSSLSGFSGTVNLTALANPSGPSLTFHPTDVVLTNHQTNSSTLSFSSHLLDNYTVIVTGVSGTLSRSVMLTVRVVDFSLSANVTSVVAPAGNNASSTITLTSLNGYYGNINLTVTVQSASILGTGGSAGGRAPLEMLPPSAFTPSTLPNASLDPASLLLASRGSVQSSLTIILSLSVQTGNYPIIVNATDGKLSHVIQLAAIATDFGISSPASSVRILAGNNSTLTLSLQPLNGYQGTVSLSATVSPSGPLAALSPTSVLLSANGNASVLTIIVPSSTLPGNYTIDVQAASGYLVHTLSIIVTVSTGPVGGLALAVDKLGQVKQILLSATSIVLALISAIVTTTISRRQAKKKNRPQIFHKLGTIHERYPRNPLSYSTSQIYRPLRRE